MIIAITIEVYIDNVDSEDETGITNEAFDLLMESLSWLGENIQINQAELP